MAAPNAYRRLAGGDTRSRTRKSHLTPNTRRRIEETCLLTGYNQRRIVDMASSPHGDVQTFASRWRYHCWCLYSWRHKVGICWWGTSRNKKVYGEDADVFRPERWLETSPEELEIMEKINELIFSPGKWQCLGKKHCVA